MEKRRIGLLTLGLSALMAGCGRQAAPQSQPPTASADVAAQPAETSAEPTSPLVGKPAPTFKLTSLDGKTIDLAALKGKPVVLDFWATWCPPCRKLTPAIQALHKDKGDKVVILGLARDEADAVRQYTKENGVTITQVIAPDDLAQTYGVDGIPTTVFIDKTGIVRDVHVGISPDDIEGPLRRAVEGLL